MTENIGTLDRAIRIVIGLALVGSPLAWYGPENMSSWGFVGLVPLVTALYGFCPIYQVLGLRTARR